MIISLLDKVANKDIDVKVKHIIGIKKEENAICIQL